MAKITKVEAENRRASIIRHAFNIVIEEGADNLSCRALSNRAGLSVGGVGHHYKKPVVLELIRPEITRFVIDTLDLKNSQTIANSWINAYKTDEAFKNAVSLWLVDYRSDSHKSSIDMLIKSVDHIDKPEMIINYLLGYSLTSANDTCG